MITCLDEERRKERVCVCVHGVGVGWAGMKDLDQTKVKAVRDEQKCLFSPLR